MKDLVGSFSLWLISRVRRMRYLHRQSVAFLVYAAATAIAYASAFLVRFEFTWPREYAITFLMTLPVLLLFRHGTHLLFRLTTSRWRYVGVQDVVRLAGAAATGSLLFYGATRLLPLAKLVPISVVAIEGLLSFLYIAAVWVTYRVAFETLRFHRISGTKQERRVIIVGAGESGYGLAREMLRRTTGYRPVGFADDDAHKWGTWLAGLEVLGATEDLATICAAYRVDEIILAIPHATPTQMRALVVKCEGTELPFRVLPSIAEVLEGNVSIDQIREVRIEDLLGREPVHLDLVELAEDLREGCALITGAAGSIGGELSRQIARHNPDVLLLLDQAESDLYYLELELRENHPELRIIPLVRDVVDRPAMETLFRTYSPTHVYHAAAYKHVPMMETNLREAIRNNVIGSYIVAEMAGRYRAKKFVLVSTDKAVNPRSVMGASKRIAEMVTLQLQARFADTIYAGVRFGNVLGSNGSVIPLFRRQLAARRPLTVTHPETSRYFMTIPEAVQLILHASLLQEIRGHVAMLEMGEPVRIVDLARNLLKLSGIRTDLNEHIIFTGLRPGEKLHEELVSLEDETIETPIEKVRLIKSNEHGPLGVLNRLPELEEVLLEGRDSDVAAELIRIFPAMKSVFRRADIGVPSAAAMDSDGLEPEKKAEISRLRIEPASDVRIRQIP